MHYYHVLSNILHHDRFELDIDFVLGQRDVLVIATEDACAYWMKLGFIWDASKDTEALNKFNDTYLLSDTV